MSRTGALHHLELWVDDLAAAERTWGWLLGRVGYAAGDRSANGREWVNGEAYIYFESGPDHRPGRHDRLRSGLNHVALWAGSRSALDALVAEAPEHGWTLLFAAEHPYAGGPEHYAAYLEDGAGFEVELVAEPPR